MQNTELESVIRMLSAALEKPDKNARISKYLTLS